MKKIICLLFLLVATGIAYAQTQQGIVKTRGRMVNGQLKPGTKLPSATVTLSIGNPVVSGQNGAFSFNVPSGKSYSLVMAKKPGYTLADPDCIRRSFSYSASNPFYVVLEDENQRQADFNAATRKVRKTLNAQLEKREKEIEALKAQNKLTEKEYQERLQQLYDNQSKSEQLVKEMAERYASTDYDQLDEFNRQVQLYIEEGELQKADSMIRSKGDMTQRVAEYHDVVTANRKARQQLEQSEAGAAKTYEDLSLDLLRRSEIFLQTYQQDSALYCLKTRADLDTTNVGAVWSYAYLCHEQKKFGECERYYSICLHAYTASHDIPNMAAIQNNLGLLYNDLHDYANSEKYYKAALENRELMFRQNPEAYRADLATTQNNLGLLYYNLHDYANSEKYYKAALENRELLFRQNLGAYRANLASTQNNLGLLYSDLHDYDNSEKYHKAALENRELLFRQNPEAYRADLATTQNNLGNFYSDLRDYANSEKYLKAALENREQLFRQNPEAYRAVLAGTQNNLGNLYRDLRDYANSEKYLKSALENYEQLFRQNPEAYRADLAGTQNNLGNLYRDLRDYDNSEKYYKSALENYEQLFRQNPEAYRAVLATMQNNLGSLYRVLRDYDNSEKCFKAALENRELLFQQNPGVYRASLATTQINLGCLYRDLRDYDNSEKYFKAALGNHELMFRQNPDAYRAELAGTCWNMLLLYGYQENTGEYDIYLEKSLALYTELYNTQPAVYINYIVELQNRKVWRLLVNGKVDEAMTLAQKTYSIDETNEQSKEYLAVCYNSKSYDYAKASDYTKAHAAIDKAISMLPGNANFYDSKGEILLMQGKNDEALAMWKKVLELNPEFLKDNPDGTNLSNGLKKLGLIE